MDALVVPTLGIDGIGTEDLQFAGIDLRRQHSDHAAVFILKNLPMEVGKHGRGVPECRKSSASMSRCSSWL